MGTPPLASLRGLNPGSLGISTGPPEAPPGSLTLQGAPASPRAPASPLSLPLRGVSLVSQLPRAPRPAPCSGPPPAPVHVGLQGRVFGGAEPQPPATAGNGGRNDVMGRGRRGAAAGMPAGGCPGEAGRREKRSSEHGADGPAGLQPLPAGGGRRAGPREPGASAGPKPRGAGRGLGFARRRRPLFIYLNATPIETRTLSQRPWNLLPLTPSPTARWRALGPTPSLPQGEPCPCPCSVCVCGGGLNWGEVGEGDS